MATLILTLPRSGLHAGSVVDYVLSPDGLREGTVASAPLALLPSASTGRVTETVLVVGAAQLSWHRVQLPKGATANSTRLRAVLVGLLEDQLLDDPATLHFALEPGSVKGASTWVAVCDRAWLHNSLQALEAAGVTVTRIVPELVPNPGADGEQAHERLYAVENAGQALLLHTSPNGVTPWPLQASTVALLRWPEDAPLRSEPAVATLAEQRFGRSVQLQSRAERALAACQSDWDLAQLDLVNNQRSRSLKRMASTVRTLLQAPRWRAARWGLLALIAVNLLGLNVRAGAERAALQAQRKAIDAVLTGTFPATQVVVDAPVQMQRAVAALQLNAGALGTRDVETLLGAWAHAAPTAPAPSGMDFANGELRLHGVTLAASALAQASQTLKGQGYTLSATGADLSLRGAP